MRISRWTFAQWGVLVICAFHLVQAGIGFALEPTFEVGHDAATTRVFGMDYNGWHAVASVGLFAPGLVCMTRNSWSVAYLLVASVAGGLPGVWAFFSEQVAIIFHFPHNLTDAVIHLATGAVMVLVALVQARLDGGLRQSLDGLVPDRRQS